jgi:hypothetical protein
VELMQRPNEPAAWPLTAPHTAAGKKAGELRDAWVEAFGRVEQVEADYAQAEAELVEAEAAIGAATTAKAAGEAEKAYAAAKARIDGPWKARLRGPVNAAREAEWDLRRHVTENLDELLTEPELGDAAEDAREAVLESARQQVAAFEEWQRVAGAHRAVVSLAEGIDGRSVPNLSPTAKAAKAATDQMLAAESSRPVAGSNALPVPGVAVTDPSI